MNLHGVNETIKQRTAFGDNTTANPSRFSARLSTKIAAICAFLLLAQSAIAQIPGPSFEDVLSLHAPSSTTISPNGKMVAYHVRTTDWKNNRYDTEIWLYNGVDAPFQLTNTKDGSSTSPEWSHDSKYIAFSADRGDKSQIHIIRYNGGEALPITNEKNGIGSFSWAPKSYKIAFTKPVKDEEMGKSREDQFGKYAVEDKEIIQSQLFYISFDPTDIPQPDLLPCDKSYTTVTCISLPESVQLTNDLSYTISNFDWSPDGSKIAFEHRPSTAISDFIQADISVVNVADQSVNSLVSGPGPDSNPEWSPDGDQIVYLTSNGDLSAIFYTNAIVKTIPANGGESTTIDIGVDEDIRSVEWEGDYLYFIARQKTKQFLYRYDWKKKGSSTLLTKPDNIYGYSLSTDAEFVALYGQNYEDINEVYLSPNGKPSLKKVSNFNGQIGDWELGTSEVVSWTSEDGATIEGVLHKPVDFDPGKKYPLLVVIHGGPTGVDRPTPVLSYVYPVNQWLAKGAVVLRPNYRGSAGYGEAFRSLNVKNLGVGDAWDVLSGVDYLIEQGFVDEDKMGAMGWSQGGYISAFLTTNTDRFTAISNGAGISNWMTYYVNTDIHPFTRQYLKATPWSDPEIYAKTSPMTNIKNASTPTLIQHGEFDRRVPIPNAYELYQGLQDVGVPTELIVYKGFGHGITKPKERLAAIWHNWQWFGKYIWGEEIKLPFEKDKEQ
ncbi:MAG: S9 family peptidase [Bacteroidota bacterium]